MRRRWRTCSTWWSRANWFRRPSPEAAARARFDARPRYRGEEPEMSVVLA
ncbi:hypothetical protein [Lysobacter gummosus]